MNREANGLIVKDEGEYNCDYHEGTHNIGAECWFGSQDRIDNCWRS